jgi:hypothetical protein
MGQTIPRQHPAVVLRSHYRQLQALVAVAMLAIAALAVAVVLLATDSEGTARSATSGPGAVQTLPTPEHLTLGVNTWPFAARSDAKPSSGR